MHAAMHQARRQIRLELLREQSFGADGAQRLIQSLIPSRLVGLELRRSTARLEGGLHLMRLAQRELRRPRGDDERHADSPPNRASIAATSPVIVDSVASTTPSSPAARAASVVIGPTDAAGRPPAASFPPAVTNAFTDDADVNVTRSASPRSRR